ncbi:WD repeat-containing protein 55 [Triplophysa rosa]|uniref:WD repeat-containing protein 55 n=1 Tax=Triplophysa rosa TaxID=992332 RepID=A0A9W7WD46_TRIRA|nr:WD repeat-containing protein 55 [Triplophysa rosa]KAI7795616.1 WD repeat-containing protein 55 [Triplophysa rosa]
MATPSEHEDSCEEETAEEPKAPKIRQTPEDIKLDAIAITLAFHPSQDILAAGDIDGDIYLYSYSCTEGENKELWSSGHHLKSCRKVVFSSDGQKLFSVSKDKAVHIMDVEAGKLVTRIPKAHKVSINALLLVDENIFATGDDEGTLKVWDLRKGTSFMDLKHHEDYISDIAVDQAKKILLTSSGDGTLGVFNIKRRRFELLSEIQIGDLTSVSIMKRGRKVVCGSTEGSLHIFNWDGFGATSDCFDIQAESVDCIVPITDSLLCAASMDGVIRAVSVLPNRVVGSIGQHVGEPIEEITPSRDTKFLASCAHDQLIKFWDISSIPDMKVNDYRRRKKKDGRLKALSNKAFDTGQNFFAGLLDTKEENDKEEEDDEEDDDSDSGSD